MLCVARRSELIEADYRLPRKARLGRLPVPEYAGEQEDHDQSSQTSQSAE